MFSVLVVEGGLFHTPLLYLQSPSPHVSSTLFSPPSYHGSLPPTYWLVSFVVDIALAVLGCCFGLLFWVAVAIAIADVIVAAVCCCFAVCR